MRKNRLCAESDGNEILLRPEKYQNQPFECWKKQLNEVNVLALIPFVRNIIEYGKDRNIGGIENIDEDYVLVTHLLHQKEKTNDITFDILRLVYSEYLGITQFPNTITLTDSVIDKLYDVADQITTNDVDLEYKIILAIAIRHSAEKYMISKIQSYTDQLTWKSGKHNITGTTLEFMSYLN